MSWQIVAICAIGFLVVAGIIWIFAGRWASNVGSGKVAKDDRDEAQAEVAEQRRILVAISQPTPKGKELRDLIAKRKARAKKKVTR